MSVARPYIIRLSWIDGTEASYEVSTHLFDDSTVMFSTNERKPRDITVPFTNIKEIVVER